MCVLEVPISHVLKHAFRNHQYIGLSCYVSASKNNLYWFIVMIILSKMSFCYQ